MSDKVKKTEAERLSEAFFVQNACNIRGVSSSLHRLFCDLMDEGGMELVHKDPAPKLFIAKILDLMGLAYGPDLDAFDEAASRLKELDPAEAKKLVDAGLGYCSNKLQGD
jgi:hypothetical protein